jgi:predicted hotdog family 3-hydroxylacyl-ACP dehydratase
MREFTLDDALLQKPPMRLLDRIITINNTHAICEAQITPQHLFYQPVIDGVYAWVGIEMMAQTAAVFVYAQQCQNEVAAPRIGFLMSVRQFQSSLTHFPAGQPLVTTAVNTLLDQEMGVFECHIHSDNQLIATAKLSAYQPNLQQLEHLLMRQPQ